MNNYLHNKTAKIRFTETIIYKKKQSFTQKQLFIKIFFQKQLFTKVFIYKKQ